MITRHDLYTRFRSTSGETSDQKLTQKIFHCTKRFAEKFEGGVSQTMFELLGLFPPLSAF